MRRSAAAALSILALAGCGASDASFKADFERGISEIRGTHDYGMLRVRVLHTLATIRRDRAPSRRAKGLAIAGFSATLDGIESRIDFVENDSGSLKAAERDSARADRELRRGARLLRAAGRLLGVRVGSLNGY